MDENHVASTGGPTKRSQAAFTIIELMVVVAIIAGLVAILLPSLASAREAARGSACLSNLHTLQRGWLMYMQGNQDRIPYTRKSYLHPNWADALDSVLLNAPEIDGNNEITFANCPTIQGRYEAVGYVQARYGYAINTWWSDDGPEYNDGKHWLRILRPARYPWFVGPFVQKWTNGHLAAKHLPYATVGGPGWGIGAHHGNQDVVNTSFADGSAKGVDAVSIWNELDGPESFRWLSNR